MKNGEATRQAVIDAFRGHLGQAQKGDVALFYYSGHGSQEQAPEEFWKLEPDRLDETLVCVDSRSPGSWDLADKEIGKLIGEVATKGPHVAVILDCCHSGSGTREVETVVRRTPTDLRRRPIESFIVSPAEAEAAASRDVDAGRFASTEGRHVLFAACRVRRGRPRNIAATAGSAGRSRSSSATRLKGAAGVPTYRDLFARASALVASHVENQSPQLEATRNDDLDATFLDGAIQPSPATFTASFREGRWSINGGATHGIPAPVGTDSARLALFPFNAPADDARRPGQGPGDGPSGGGPSLVQPAGDRGQRHARPEADLQGAPHQPADAPPRRSFWKGTRRPAPWSAKPWTRPRPRGGPRPSSARAGVGDAPEFRLVARDGQFVITRPEDARPLVAPIEGLNEAGARLAVQRLEHMARWTQTARLSNPASSIRPGDVKLTILVDDKDVSGREIRLEYLVKDGKQVEPTFRVSMTNNSPRTLFCGLLDLTQRYRVFAGLLKAGCVRLKPGETAWGNLGNPIPATVPDEIWKQGVIEYKDLLKLIVCTEEFDARLLEQPTLDMPRSRGGTRRLPRNGSLNRLMQKVQTRELGDSEPVAIDDWQATEVSFTTVRPLATTSVPGPGQAAATLAGGVKLDRSPHPQGQGPAVDRAPLHARPGQCHAPADALR